MKIQINHWFILSIIAFGGIVTLPHMGSATPIYALKESQNCGGCHKPGRTQKPPLWRRCTLDCQGCHIDPTGGGPRNQWGTYYTYDQISMRNFFVAKDPLEDRSRIDFHYDGRIMVRKTPTKTRTFPMNSEFAVRIRPLVEYLHLTYQNQLFGRVDDELFRILTEGDRRFRERYSIMVDGIPFNTYVRTYRGTPMYGLKRSNHSLWIRERIGLDQFATTDAYEIGLTPNVPFFRYSQMSGDPYIKSAFRQKGSSAHAGMRGVSFGWHINGSYWKTASDMAEVDMHAVGAGFNAFGVIGYGERNFRNVKMLTEEKNKTDPQPGSTISEYSIAYGALKGLIVGFMKEQMEVHQDESDRNSLFVDVHPIPFLHFEWWYRKESGPRDVKDHLLLAHLYGDF